MYVCAPLTPNVYVPMYTQYMRTEEVMADARVNGTGKKMKAGIKQLPLLLPTYLDLSPDELEVDARVRDRFCLKLDLRPRGTRNRQQRGVENATTPRCMYVGVYLRRGVRAAPTRDGKHMERC